MSSSKKSNDKECSQEEPKICHLLELPAELRECIWELALTGEALVYLYPNPETMWDPEPPPTYEEPGLLSVCRQIRQEALPIYYLSRDFAIDFGCWHTSKLIALEAKCKMMGILDKMNMDVDPIQAPGWEETMKLCEHIHSGGKWYPDETTVWGYGFPEPTPDTIMYCAAVEMTKTLMAVGWQTCN